MRIFWLLLMMFSVLSAEIPQGAINAVKANPALLDTPQAQTILKQKGVTKEQAIKQLQSNSGTGHYVESDTVKQNIREESGAGQETTLDEQNTQAQNPSAAKIETGHPFKNPILYMGRKALIQESLKLQQKWLKAKGLPHFGFNFFANANTFNPRALPTPDYYILTPEDVLVVQTYGSTNKIYRLTIDNNGQVMIPVVGPKRVGGKSFKEAKEELSAIIEKTFPGIKVSVNIEKFSTIQVTLTGEAKAPGLYNLPSLSTVQTLLVQAHGVLPTGTLRNIEIYRNGQRIYSVDLYALLTGHPGRETLLRAGDVVHVPKAKRQVAIYGEIKKPAIYELKNGEKGTHLLSYAGGLTPKAGKDAIVLTRYDAHQALKSYRLTLEEFQRFELKDGDQVCIYPIDGLKKENVYLFGNVIKPGPRALKPGMTLHGLLQREAPRSLSQLFLPYIYLEHAYLKRRTPMLEESIVGFNPMDVYTGKSDIILQKDDEIYFLNRYDIMQTFTVSIGGQVLNPGLYRYIEGMTLNDLLHAAGQKGLADNKVRITTYPAPDYMPKIVMVDKEKNRDYLLSPADEVYLFDYYKTHNIAKITINGEVVKPGTYSLGKGATLEDLIEAAGGLTERASKKGEIVRYYIENDERKRKIVPFRLDASDMKKPLKNHDVVTVFRIPKWNEQMRVYLKGEVKYPGTYVVSEGDTLADVIERAGGFTKTAFLDGAVFTRESVKKMQRAQLAKALNRLKKRVTIVAAQPDANMQSKDLIDSINAIIQQAKEVQPIGRIAIDLKNPKKLKKSDSNIVLKDGDTLYVPTKNDTVSVLGEVLNPTAVVYRKSMNAWDYIDRAGGLSDNANEDSIYIVHANGMAEKIENGIFFAGTNKVKPGDSIVVPIHVKTTSNMQIAKDATQIVYQTAVAIAAVGSL